MIRVRPVYVVALFGAMAVGILGMVLQGGEERAVRKSLARVVVAVEKGGEETIFEASQKSGALADCLASPVRIVFESGNEHSYSWSDRAECARNILRARALESSIRVMNFEIEEINATGAGLVYARCRVGARCAGAVNTSFRGDVLLQLARHNGRYLIQRVTLRSAP